MSLQQYKANSLLFNINFLEATSTDGLYGFRGELVLVEGEVADAKGHAKPPEEVLRGAAVLADEKVKLVIGDATVPVGSYTRTVLNNLGISPAVMKNVVSQETDVKGVLGKVALGEADAGFVYVTDAKSVLGKVGVIRIRESAQPHIVYEVAVVKKAPHLRQAYAFVTRLIRAPAQRTLVRYGFGRKPLLTPAP